MVDSYSGKIYYVEIDIEADPEIAEAAGVNGTPTVQVRRQVWVLRAAFHAAYQRALAGCLSVGEVASVACGGGAGSCGASVGFCVAAAFMRWTRGDVCAGGGLPAGHCSLL